jgi:hypothetical protein
VFFVVKELIYDSDENLEIILKKMEFIPIEVFYEYFTKKFIFRGYSPIFREISEGEITPLYIIVVKKDSDNNIDSIDAIEAKQDIKEIKIEHSGTIYFTHYLYTDERKNMVMAEVKNFKNCIVYDCSLDDKNEH